MKDLAKYENISGKERIIRFIVSYAVIVGAMESSLVGTSLYAVINLLAIAFATTAIIGWDPAKALSLRSGLKIDSYNNTHGSHHA